MTGSGEPRGFLGVSVSADAFPTLRVTPMIGRTFTADDDRAGAAGTVMLSYRLWQTEFGGDPSVLGRSLTFDVRRTLSSASCRANSIFRAATSCSGRRS